MVAKSIVDIDVNDDKFVAFMERFREYQSALDDLPEAWRVAAVGIGESSKQTEKAKGEAKELGAEFNAVAEAILTINSGIDRLNTNLEDSKKKQDEFNKEQNLAEGLSTRPRKMRRSWLGTSKRLLPASCYGVELSGYLPESLVLVACLASTAWLPPPVPSGLLLLGSGRASAHLIPPP